MTGTPTFAVPQGGFLGLSRHGLSAACCIAGIPLDIGTTHRAGTRFGPGAIRKASGMLTDGAHPGAWIEPVSELDLSDIGDFAIALGDIAESLLLIEEQAARVAHLVALGGEHGVTLALLRALSKRTGPLALVHFDAHVDTWPDNFGQKFGHGSVFFHAINEGLIDPRRTIQLGIRSPVQREVWDWTVGHGVTILTAQDIHASTPDAVAARVHEVVGGHAAYLSFDIDSLDPAFAPGTGTPEIGGLASWQAQAILRRLAGLDFRGMDLVEVAPAYDVSEITALAGATMVWEYLALMGERFRAAA